MVKKGDKGGEKKSSLLLETWGWFYENTKSKQNEQETREQAAEEGPGFGLTAQESRLGSWAEWAGHPRYKSAGPCPLHRGTSLAPQPCEPHPEGAEAPSPRTSLGSPDLGKTRQGPRAQSPRAPLPAGNATHPGICLQVASSPCYSGALRPPGDGWGLRAEPGAAPAGRWPEVCAGSRGA